MRRAAAGLLALPLALSLAAPAGAAPSRQAVVFVLRGLTFEQAARQADLAPLIRGGGLGLFTTAGRTGEEAHRALAAGGGAPGALAEALRDAGRSVEFLGADPTSPARLLAADGAGRVMFDGVAGDPCCDADLLVVDAASSGSPTGAIRETLEKVTAEEILVLVVEPEAPAAAREVGDSTTPVIVASNPPSGERCPPTCGLGLASGTTRRPGVVSHVDVAPTVLAFLGVPVPEEMPGSSIRIEGERPDDLHARYLAHLRVYPFAAVAVPALVTIALIAGFVVLSSNGRGRGRGRGARGAHLVWLVALALPVALLPVSALPSRAPAAVASAAAGLTALLVWLAVRAGRGGDRTAPVALLGGAGVVAVALDGLLGWPGLFMPFVGGSSLEGVRFYGLGNGFGGLLVAGAVVLVTRVRPLVGVAVLLAAGWLAGAPGFGANLGVATTLFAVAGLWFPVRVRRGVVGLLAGAAIAGAAFGLLLLAHRGTADPTHVTRALEAGGALGTFLHRLGLVVEGTNRVPLSWLFVAGLPAGLWVAWRRLSPAGRWLTEAPAWREACIVLALAGIVGYLVNDTYGVAAMAFTFLAGALLAPPLRARWAG